MAHKSFSELEMLNSSEYKQYHESFMQNNQGSTALHTYLCIFFTILCSLYCCISDRRPPLYQYLFEYSVIVIPLILAHTILSDYIPLLSVIAFTFVIVKCKQNYSHLDIMQPFTKLNSLKTQRVHSITVIRALTYLITVFCILAVDFQCFPRHLAKTERWGYSLMDTGVGLFVLMSGVVHKYVKKDNFSVIIKGNTKFILILVFLGIARFWSVKQLDYQEHVTEYGVHWNFFFTLAVCKLLSSVVLFFTNHALFLSMLTMCLHEIILWYGLQTWVFGNEPRTTLLSANREGVSSCLGYVSLYLFAAYFKTVINNRNVTRYHILRKMFLLSVLLCIACNIVHYYRPSSRTLANAGYCLYLEATFLSISTFMYLFDVLCEDADNKLQFEVPMILSAINRNGLLYFLVSNLMTGMINLSMRTLLVSTIGAITIFLLYMALSICLTLYLVKKGIKI